MTEPGKKLKYRSPENRSKQKNRSKKPKRFGRKMFVCDVDVDDSMLGTVGNFSFTFADRVHFLTSKDFLSRLIKSLIIIRFVDGH